MAKIPVEGGVGDIESTEIGTGARFNSGKDEWDLLPLGELAAQVNFSLGSDQQALQEACASILWELGRFQQTGDKTYLRNALQVSTLGIPGLDGYAPGVRVFSYGKKKYAAWNWAKGMMWSVPLGCAVRHIRDIFRGEVDDAESGLPHIGHIQCNLWMLLLYTRTFPQGNDLPVNYLGNPS